MGICLLPSTKCTHTRTVYKNAATHTDKLEDAVMDDTNPNSNTNTHCCQMLRMAAHSAVGKQRTEVKSNTESLLNSIHLGA